LQANPRGVLIARDELAGWVKSFDAYKAKGLGGDVQRWIELSRAGPLEVDRKGVLISIPNAAVSVTGTIQPGTLAGALTPEHFESGLAARLLLARPPDRVKQWTDATPNWLTVAGYNNAIAAMLDLKHVAGNRGPEAIVLPLSRQAREAWIAWYDAHATRQAAAESEREAAALAKIEAYSARFALIFELLDAPDAGDVTLESMRRGTALADWFAHEAGRVYEMLGEGDEDRDRRQLVALVERVAAGIDPATKRERGVVAPRDLMRSSRRFKTAGESEAALDDLAAAGAGAWESSPPGPAGGRPGRVFRLRKPEAADDDRNAA
jgi:hypothetical protein